MKNVCDCQQCKLKEIFFKQVSSHELESFCSEKEEKRFKRGDIIIQSGEEIEEFLYLKEGLVKLYRTSTDEKQQIITIAKPFDFVSLLSVFSSDSYNYSVEALTDSTTCNLKFKKILNLIDTNPKFSFNLLQKMSEISDKIIIEFMEIRQRNLRGRVAYILLYFSERIFFSDRFELPLLRREIAEYIGMTTENVIRAMSELRRDDIIDIDGKMIRILNQKDLAQISAFG